MRDLGNEYEKRRLALAVHARVKEGSAVGPNNSLNEIYWELHLSCLQRRIHISTPREEIV